MARPPLVIDASVGVKWFISRSEPNVPQSRSILKAQADGEIDIVVPDLFFHEISNTLVHKRDISLPLLNESLDLLFDLGLSVFHPDQEFFRTSAQLARKNNITEYDACYAVIAIHIDCPLVTANPRHQKTELGCRVIPIEDWGSR